MVRIRLLPAGPIPPAVVRRLAAELERRFQARVEIDPPIRPPPHWLDPGGAGLSATAILDDLVAHAPAEDTRRLALVRAELSAPGLRATCGLATLGGCCGVVAMPPDTPSRRAGSTRAPRNADAAFHRLLVGAVHELGHMAGLPHCDEPDCVMHFSPNASDVDRKPAEFCPRCRR